jgi:large subunit ribosomal protein L17
MSHRHGYQGRKFGRERDQRRALIKGLATALIEHESIETTLPKAKAIVPYIERLITKAKKGDLHNRRQIIAKVETTAAAHKLVDELAPRMSGRVSGHVRIERTSLRRGDGTQMARVSFVDQAEAGEPAPAPAQPAKAEAAAATKTAKPKADKAEAKPASRKPAAAKAKQGEKA